MGFKEWTKRSLANVQKDGIAGIRESLYELYTGLWRICGWHIPRGTNIYDRNWDVLIILDACRVDLMREVANEYSFIDDVKTFRSVGSMSEEWMRKTFTPEYDEEINNTVYVTANVFSDPVLNAENFQRLDEVWRYAWDDELGIVPPRPVTDQAINTSRNENPDRLIVHYMQPHHPFIGSKTAVFGFDADPFGREDGHTVVDALRWNEIEREQFWRAYKDTLRYVLDDVQILLSNIEAENTVITADHGDALGEWGVYDHPAGFLHPVVTQVPWIRTTAEDMQTYEPSLDFCSPYTEPNQVTKRLKELGYL